MSKYKQKEKEAYMNYYREAKRRNKLGKYWTKIPQKFGTWLRLRRGSKGVSKQSRRQFEGLSEADAKALQKFMRK
jgi:hypothetical protein